MTLSVIRSIGTLDRTGVVQDALARIDAERFDELDVVRPGDLEECEVDVDVLLVGSKELTQAGLRRIARWRSEHPVSVAIAHLNGSAMDKSVLASGGIGEAVRGPLTVTKLRNALDRADAALGDLLDAAERHQSSFDEEEGEDASHYEDDFASSGEYGVEAYPADTEYVRVGEIAENVEDDEVLDLDAAVQSSVPVHTVTEINEGVTSAAGRFSGVIRGVIAEVEGAAHTTNGYAPVVVAEPTDPHHSNGHHDGEFVVLPTQAVVGHDDLDEAEGELAKIEAEDAEYYDESEYEDDTEAAYEPVAPVTEAHYDFGAVANDDAQAEDADEPVRYDARVVTIASATGGCGKTFFATSIATVFARMGWKVLLVDLDLQFGEVAAALQIHHPYSIYDGLYKTNGEQLEAEAFLEHLPELVCHHTLGFDVLTAPRDPVLADYVGARDAGVVLDSVVDLYDIVLVDTPPSLNDVVIAALDRSDIIQVLATPDVPSLRNLTTFIDILSRLGLEDTRLRLVLNKVEPDVGVTVAQANEAFDGRFKTLLPTDRAVSRSVNLGTTAPVNEPRSKISRAVVPAAVAIAHDLALRPTTASLTSAVTTYNDQSTLRRLWRALFGGKS
jgi:MinD-like ATPase involved in chromosome partitioning or flagellar assembly